MSQPLPRADGLPAGLRARKKLKTRFAIQEHALRLFHEQGYAKTTVEQIAEAAEVSPSTFFRYFPTKEDVVMFDALDLLLVEGFRRQPAELSPIRAFRAAIHEIIGRLTPGQLEEQRERGRLVLTVPELQAAWVADLLRTAGVMAAMLAERTGRDPNEARVRMYTGAVIGALIGAMVPMVENPEADFVADLDAALDFLEGGLQL
jgi:AcrR family transcriptional regulator